MQETLTITLPIGMTKEVLLATIAEAYDYKTTKELTTTITVTDLTTVTDPYIVISEEADANGKVINHTLLITATAPASMSKAEYGALVIGKELVTLFSRSVEIIDDKTIKKAIEVSKAAIKKTVYDYSSAMVE
jgi:hypothetical protein